MSISAWCLGAVASVALSVGSGEAPQLKAPMPEVAVTMGARTIHFTGRVPGESPIWVNGRRIGMTRADGQFDLLRHRFWGRLSVPRDCVMELETLSHSARVTIEGCRPRVRR